MVRDERTGVLGQGLLGSMLLGGGLDKGPGPGGSNLTMPKIIIECAFGFAPFASSFTWTDITNWCQAFSTKRGRQHELQRFEAGTLELVLNNQDGRFSPWNTGSPYSPNLVPSTPIRVRAKWSGTTYPVYFGFVDSWIPQYGQIRAEQVIKAADGMQLLALGALDQSAYPGTILADTPQAYYELSDMIGSTSAIDSTGNGYTGSTNGFVSYGQQGPLLTGILTAAKFGGGGAKISCPAAVTGNSISFEGWINTTNTVAQCSVYSAGLEAVFSTLLTTGQMQFYWVPGSTVIYSVTNVCDGKWHHVVATTDGSTIRLYVDGVQEASASAGGTLISEPVTIGDGPGTVAQVAAYQYTLTPTQVNDHYLLGSTGWLTPQTSGDRIGAVLDIIGWPSGQRSLSAGISEVQGATSSLNQTASLSYIQTVEATEQGQFFVDEAGNATFYDRHYIISAPAATTSNGTFANDTNPAHYHYLAGLVPASDDLDLWNDVPGSRQNGVLQQSTDPTSIGLYGYRTLTGFTGMLQTNDEEVLSLTQWLLAHYKDPIPRVRSMAVNNLSGAGANFPQMLGRKLMDRITLEWLPKDGSSVMFNQDSLIESIQHDVTPATWQTTWGLTPAESANYWTLNDPTLGTIGTTNMLAY